MGIQVGGTGTTAYNWKAANLLSRKKAAQNQNTPTLTAQTGDDVLAQATVAQGLGEQNKQQAHHAFKQTQLPLCVTMGFLIYGIGMKINPGRQVMNNFKNLLDQNQALRRSINQLNQELVSGHGQVPSHLRLPLSNLQVLLHASDTRPSAMYPYMDQIRTLGASNEPRLKSLAAQTERYQGLMKKILGDRKGFELLADEPRIRRQMGLGKPRALELARRDRETFFVKLFANGLSDDRQLGKYHRIFQQLEKSHWLKVRLAAVGLPAAMFGYFFSRLTMRDKVAEQF